MLRKCRVFRRMLHGNGMDEVVEKPETYGLPRNWSAGMME